MDQLRHFWNRYHTFRGGSPPILVVGRWIFGAALVLILLGVVAMGIAGNNEAISLLGAIPGAGLLYGITLVDGLFPKKSFNFDASVPVDGPGRYVISGVDRETKMDTSWHVEANSAANAKAKAELEGIVVTDVRRA